MTRVFSQQHPPRGNRHIDALLAEAAKDAPPQLVSHPKLVSEFGHIVVET